MTFQPGCPRREPTEAVARPRGYRTGQRAASVAFLQGCPKPELRAAAARTANLRAPIGPYDWMQRDRPRLEPMGEAARLTSRLH